MTARRANWPMLILGAVAWTWWMFARDATTAVLFLLLAQLIYIGQVLERMTPTRRRDDVS